MRYSRPETNPDHGGAMHLAGYRENGYASAMRVFNAAQVAGLRAAIQALEATHGEGAGGIGLRQMFRGNGHVVIPLLAEFARTPAILDAVEPILGRDILVWSVNLFIKEPGSAKTVSWHQDLTYWGMGETDEQVTAWVALSDVSVAAGCMRFLPGSHRQGIVAHTDTFDNDNLLSRGQEIAGVDETRARHAPLRPGEMSLHHGRCFHASGRNRSDDRRIGVAIRYVSPGVRDGRTGRDYAMLVRGVSPAGGWTTIAGAQKLFETADLALFRQIAREQAVALNAGARQKTKHHLPKDETA